MNKKRFTMVFVMALFAFVTLVSNANAVIKRSTNGVGDALLFPFFDADALNYVCISNESNKWIQAHVRLRTAADSIEGKDFPLILSPGDMAIFEVTRNNADGNKDGLWRIDYSIDTHNFQYVRINSAPVKSLADIATMKNDYAALASADNLADTVRTEVNKRYGYIEVFGEAVFDQGLNKTDLLTPGGCTNTTRYVASPSTKTLSDVPNVLSGKLYVMEGKYGTGMAYNAIAFDNFRTNGAVHRVDNYLIDTGVILSSENATINNATEDDYTYMFAADLARKTSYGNYEALVSVNNTWGPTFADGDEYLNDVLDSQFGPVQTSVREVENALRNVSVRGHYFNVENFQTNLALTLPTKHHVLVNPAMLVGVSTFEQYKSIMFLTSKRYAPSYKAELWDTDENSPIDIVPQPFEVSPYIPVIIPTIPNTLPYELTCLIPKYDSKVQAGRFVLSIFDDAAGGAGLVDAIKTLPIVGLSYINMSGKMGYMTETQY